MKTRHLLAEFKSEYTKKIGMDTEEKKNNYESFKAIIKQYTDQHNALDCALQMICEEAEENKGSIIVKTGIGETTINDTDYQLTISICSDKSKWINEAEVAIYH